jgi:hypothetical protein
MAGKKETMITISNVRKFQVDNKFYYANWCILNSGKMVMLYCYDLSFVCQAQSGSQQISENMENFLSKYRSDYKHGDFAARIYLYDNN